MKIGLIDPGSKKLILNENFPHLGLAYIAATLKKNDFDVNILDISQAGEDVFEDFLQKKFDVIGFSATSFTFAQTLELAKRIRVADKEAIIVLGGPHVSIAMESALMNPYIDFAIFGEGELTMLELVQTLSKDKMPSIDKLSSIKGLIFKDKDKVKVNLLRPRIDDLDALAFPAFNLFQMEQYGIYPLLTSRGCPFGCTFCSIESIWGKSWKHRSPENIVQEIDYTRNRFNWRKKPFSIIDDSFNVNPKRVFEFCELIIESGMNIQWFSAGFRADKVSFSLAVKMKESGCIGVAVGIESANNEILKKIKKKETIEEIEEGCNNMARAGIPVQAQFMIGNPMDTLETVKESIDFSKKQRFANTAFYLALPYPKTELWDYVKQNGKFLKDDYTQFHHFSDEPVFETPEFTAEERIVAYQLGRKIAVKNKLKEELRTKIERIKRLDFKDMSLGRIFKAGTRMTKYFLDLLLRRNEKV